MKNKLIRITTVPISLDKLLEGQLAFMENHYHVIAISSEKKYLKEIGEKNGVETFCVNMTRRITPLQDIKSLWNLYRFFKKEKPMIVHTHTPKAGTVGMIAAKLAKIPYRLHTIAGLPLLEAKGKKRILLNIVEKITYACSTSIYSNSIGLKNIILKEGFCPVKKIKVIGNGSSNGINTSYFDPSLFQDIFKNNIRSELSIKKSDFIFIFIGRLVSDKGVNELVEAFDYISKFYINAKLLLVGNAEPELDPLKENTKKILTDNKKIIAVGFQKDVRPYLSISNLLVFPSYREGFPNVVMQAGAMGLPSIVTDINGSNEIIINNLNGVVIPAKNAYELQKNMIHLMNNTPITNRMQNVAREMIISRYQQHVIWESLLAEYKNLEQS